GRSGELVKDGGKWRLSSDDGSRVERLTDTTNDDDNDEYWKVTTTDGTQYFFGKHRLPGWASGDEVTNSVWTAPVFGDDLNEPCNDATFASSHCDQAWRWNLDHVIDTHGNAVSYFYAKETNHYALNGKTDVNGTAYTRGGYLKQIDYGQRANAVYSTPAPARVLFDTSERCLPSGQITCAPGELNESTAQYWPDVPWDRNCEASTHCELSQLTPTFWTRKRLTEITTEARVAGAYSKVSSWKLEHTFISNADTTRSLWLHKVTRSGHLGGSTVTLPSTELLGDQFANRVDKIGDSISPLIRPRLATVYTDTGGQLDVNYSPEDCTPADTPAPASNTRRCYPVKWQPGSQQNPITDWFHKYVVTGVTASDRVGGSPDQVTMYDYVGGAAWRHTKPDGITKTDDLTWGDWRGYEKVRVFSAPGTTLETRVDQTYFRGMHGDDNGSSGTRDVTVTDSTSVAHTDYDELAGELLESMVYNDTDVVSKTITSRWRHITATDAHSWGDQKSAFVRPKTARGFVALEAGGWRETKTVTTYDTSYGRPVEVDDLADVSTPDDDQCTRTEFTDNTGMNIVSLPARSETVSVACAATPNRDTQVVADDRITYHGEAFGTEPLEPGKTSMITQELESHDGVTATYVTVADVEYDTYGRATKVTDAEGKATSTVYTDTDGLTTRQEVTNALGHASATVLNPAIGEPASATDANGMLTELSYDALGRLSAVWLANRSKATGKSPNVKFDYTVTDGAPVSVKTETLTNDETYRASYEVFDGWLRSRQAQTPAAPDARLVTDTSYDAVGRVKTVNDAYAATGAPSGALLVVADGAVNGQSTNVYDNAGRIVAGVFAVAGVEKWRSTASYGGDRVHSTPPAGGTPTTAIVDALGRTVELRQYHGGSPSGEYDATTYTHTRRGELKTVTDEAGNTWSYAYDDRGRKTSSTDPDAGTTTFDYDDLGLLISTTDARGKTISHTYDDLDRKTATYRGDPNTGTKVAEWYWDLYDKGQLAGTRSYDGELELTHVINDRDTLYRPIRETYTLGGTGAGALTGSYQFNPSYNIDGTLKGTTFPAAGGMAGEGVLNTYDTLGRAKDIDGDLAYADNIQYSPTGLLAQVGLFAGAKQSWRTFEYEKGSNRLDRAFLSTAQVTGTTADTRYGYDPAGNVTSIIDDPTAAGGQRDAQCFDYDHLRRLTTAWTTATGGDGAAA
ncbi:MAG: SpvB/TcaC N-terminal domain-containing protein, partial [Micromonosporaceae bacterium]